MKLFDPADLAAPSLRVLGRPDVDLTRRSVSRGQLAWSAPESGGLWQAWQGAATAWRAGRVRYVVLSIQDEEEIEVVQQRVAALKRARSVDLKMPEPKNAARVKFSGEVGIRISADLALLSPVKAPTSLLLLADELDIIRAWHSAYASSQVPCRTRMPRKLPSREARPPMKQTSFIP